jgi:hypothetical protein
MSQGNFFNRRSEMRYHCLRDPVTWQVATYTRQPGRLLDISYSGLAFETQFGRQLRVGFVVNLIRRCDQSPMLCQIISLQQQSDHRWRAGCKRLTPAGVLANNPDKRPFRSTASHAAA